MRAGRAAAVAALTTFIVLAFCAPASAAWTSATVALTATPTAAAATATLTGTSALASEYKFAVASPSTIVVEPLTVSNTGTAPLSYTLTAVNSGSLSPSLVAVSLWLAGAGVCQATVPTTPGQATTGTLAALPALPSGAGSAAGGVSFLLCAATSLSSTVAASQGQSITATLTVTGRVGSNWVAVAAGAPFIQDIFRTGDPGVVVRTQKSTLNVLGIVVSTYVTLSWAAPTSTGTGLTYPIIRSGTGALVKTATATSVDIVWADLASSPQTLLVQAKETQYGTTSAGRPITLTGNAGVLGLLENVTCP
ncbi:hypothetical protein [Subtercola frigoramans]|uniref:DUF11 domain-containing protein n=1 Tax=Subtercola frigoramans TaxID=120298 RepID=A0ABS2L7C6_9MICO|nr:hypothetical protein [Subtercola frigoramans]MBM7473006.1 hypothetical protein [Subtercola frigoramans]